MRLTRIITAAVAVVVMALTAVAQTPANRPATGTTPATRPAATAPATSAPATQPGDAKIAVIDIAAFGDEKAGIARLLSAYATLQREFKPRQDELNNMRTRGQALAKEYENLQKGGAAVDPASVQKKLDEIQTLEKELKRKQEDAQQLFERREGELTGPVWEDINNALKAYAQQRGISIIMEKSRLSGNNLIFFVDDKADITRAFITEYNQRNPATAAAAPANR
jgi:Skp family chaperone for outer membrane proteins